MDEKGFYTPHEVAAFFGVTPQTVYSWIWRGRLPAVKIGQWKIPARALEAFRPPENGRPRSTPDSAQDPEPATK